MDVHAHLRFANGRVLDLYTDAIDWDGTVRHSTKGPILRSYLHANRNRWTGLLLALPEEAKGIRAHCTVRDGQLWLERVSVPGREDVLLDMMLWNALFPGLKTPQVVFWVSGTHDLTTDPPFAFVTHNWDWYATRPASETPSRSIRLDRGVVLEALPEAKPVTRKQYLDGDIFEWPLWLRVLMLPLVMLVAPVAMLVFCLDPRERGLPLVWYMVPLIPLLTVACLFSWCAPVTFDRYFEHHMDRIGARARHRKAVRDLVKKRSVPESPIRKHAAEAVSMSVHDRARRGGYFRAAFSIPWN